MEIKEYVKECCLRAKNASTELSCLSEEKKNRVLLKISDFLMERSADIVRENEKDIQAAKEAGLSEAMIERLTLTPKRIEGISDSLKVLSELADPCGSGRVFSRPNGLVITEERVPIGVVGMIYESRPNVTVDAAALCLKTGNAVVLRGGKEAIFSNRILTAIMREALMEVNLNPDAVVFLDSTSRESSTALMEMRGLVDVLIPRGGRGLIQSVVENAKVPVIETGAGNCHLFVDRDADIAMALDIAVDAKVSRPSVCNAAESVLVHREIASQFLPKLKEAYDRYGVEIRGCEKTSALIACKAATEEDFFTEYNDYIVSVKVVNDVKEAVAHINRFSTHHSEAILTSGLESANYFTGHVDSAAVYVNASTRFSDGGEFGFGAEIGISTQKLHARGPMGPLALTTVKYKIVGQGQTRNMKYESHNG